MYIISGKMTRQRFLTREINANNLRKEQDQIFDFGRMPNFIFLVGADITAKNNFALPAGTL